MIFGTTQRSVNLLYPIIIMFLPFLVSGCTNPESQKGKEVTRKKSTSSNSEKSVEESPTIQRLPQPQEQEKETNPFLILHAGQLVGEAEQRVRKFGGSWSKGRAYMIKGGLDPSRYRTFRIPFGPSGYLTLTSDHMKVKNISYQDYPPELKGKRDWHITKRLKWKPVSYIEVGETVRDVKKKVKLARGRWLKRPQFGTSQDQNLCTGSTETSGFTIKEIKEGPYHWTRGVKLCVSQTDKQNTPIITRIYTCQRINLPEEHRNWHATNLFPIADF